jgi:MmyB-like transcription regulator ligand binding domain
MAAALLGDFSALPAAERNIVWRFFTDPAASARHDPAALRTLIGRLNNISADFRDRWADVEVSTGRSTRKRLRHPAVGWLNLDCDALHDPERDHWVILYTAAPGTPDHDALRLLNVIGTQDLTARQ